MDFCTAPSVPADRSLRREVLRLLRLAMPMMAAQGGLILMGVVDTLVIGRVSALEMGAVALGNTISSVSIVLGLGLVMGIEPLVSQAHGAGESERTRHFLWQGGWLALWVAGPLVLLMAVLLGILVPIGVEPELVGITNTYVFARMIGVPFNALYGAARSYLTSIERTRPILFAVLIANLVNGVLDLWLVFGLGWGALGVGLATSGCWMLMFAIVARAAWMAESSRVSSRQMVLTDVWKIARLGLPIGLQLGAEVGVFALVSVLIARFGEVVLAGHHIAITLASLAFMSGVGLAVASATRVGMYVGAERSDLARRSGGIAMMLGGVLLACIGVIYGLFSVRIAHLFAPNEPDVVIAGAAFLRIAAVFSLSDGVQVVAAGALRGAGDTLTPLWANLAAHWAIGLPMALFLGHGLGLGAVGYWWGLTLGLTVTALWLALRFERLTRRAVARV